MKRVAQVQALTLVFGLVPATANNALAQRSDDSNSSASEDVIPPRLVRFVEAEWPTEEAARPNVSVLFELTVDTTGHVAQLSIVESAGPAFARAAEIAVSLFVFESAHQGTTPISVRLRYRYEFRVPSGTTPTQADKDPSTTIGLAAMPPSTSNSNPVRPRSSRHGKSSGPDASPSEPASDSNAEPLTQESYTAVAQITAPPREVTKHSVEQQDLTKIPGTSGDALRAIEVMPGVARTSISSGDPILRGAAWHESRSYLEGTTVPLLYHFGGVKSAFNSRLLSRVDLYPGNYGTSYGRAVGGVIAAKIRDPQRDRLHALAEASVIDSMALVETPIGEKAAIAVAARRSNVDFFYDAVAPKSSFNVVAAPTYYDYQGIGWVQLHPRHQLRILSYGSRDALKLVFANPSDFDPALRDQIDFSISYHRLQAALDSDLSPRLTQRVQLTYGYTTMRQMMGPLRSQMGQHEAMSRGEWNYRAADSIRINVGYDLEALSLGGYYIGSRPPQAEGEVMNGGMSTESVVDVSDLNRIYAVRPGGYAEVEWRPLPPILVVPGVRVDFYSDQRAWTVNPRLSARYDIQDRFSVKWGVGVYSQNPQYYELIRNFGNPNLRPYHAQQYSAGVEHRPTETLSWGLDGFYKHLFNRVVSTPGGAPPTFLNDGIGRIYGAELFARYTGSRLRGWLAYTLSRSERRDRADPWRLFEQDQTHVLALTAYYQLGRGWEIGGRFRLTSGNPYTPVRGSVYDAAIDAYRPIDAPPFSARNPMFQQLDLRVEKAWQFGQWRLAWYLDVQNVYNAKNAEGFDYSYDYQRRQSIPGLSTLPNLGLRGEL